MLFDGFFQLADLLQEPFIFLRHLLELSEPFFDLVPFLHTRNQVLGLLVLLENRIELVLNNLAVSFKLHLELTKEPLAGLYRLVGGIRKLLEEIRGFGVVAFE